MGLNLPTYSNSRAQGAGKPFEACLLFAARYSNLPKAHVSWVLDLFFQEVIRQVLQGNIVRIRNFGSFGVRSVRDRYRKRRTPRPIWESCSGFRGALKKTMTVEEADAVGEKLSLYSWNANRKSDKALPPALAHERFRASIAKQAKRAGYDLPVEEPNDYLRRKFERPDG
jgi:hypothetical protein